MKKNLYFLTLIFSSFHSFAQDAMEENNVVNDTILLSKSSIEKSGLTQEQIVKLDETTRILLADYQATSKEFDSLKLYNDQVQKIINSQIEEIENIILKIDELDKTNQRIVPLMLKMIDGLENFVLLDLPFLMKERSTRVLNLKETMDRGDISTSEKFRLITEAYKTELEYGRTIETYRDNILIDDVETDTYITPIECVSDFSVFVSRLRIDNTLPNGINMWVVADNLRKGTALNSVQIAEELINRKFI